MQTLFKNLECPLFTVFSLVLFFTQQVCACDVCNIFEYANRNNQSYIGVFYRQRFFNGYKDLNHTHNYTLQPQQFANARMEHVPDGQGRVIFNRNPNDFELYHTVELRGNYAYKNKWNFQAIVPYVFSKVYYKEVFRLNSTFQPLRDSTLNINGMGDIVIAIDRILLYEPRFIRHMFKPGVAIKAPTGHYQLNSKSGQQLGHDLQPGTGSWDFLLRFNYLVTNDWWGVDVFTNYRYCTTSPLNVQFGQRYNAMLSGFYTFRWNQLKCLPRSGLYYEWADFDVVENQKLLFTGGQTWFYQAGFDVMTNKIIFQALFQKPFYEQLNGNIVIGNAGRLSIGVVYNLF